VSVRSVDPAGQHELAYLGTETGPMHSEYWRQFPEFEIPKVPVLRDTDDASERVRIVIGSDLLLTVYAIASEGVVIALSDANDQHLCDLGRSRTVAEALAALPVLVDIARSLCPNWLLMNKHAKNTADQ
jgi:hypothetical protein